jgi:hypothetical protein
MHVIPTTVEVEIGRVRFKASLGEAGGGEGGRIKS